MGGVSSKITQATRVCIDEVFTHTICMYIYVHYLAKKKKFVMGDDNFVSCHFNSIKPLNVLVNMK